MTIPLIQNGSPNFSREDNNRAKKKRQVDKAAKIAFSDSCFICERKPYPIPFNCRCGGIYCIKHKQPEDHFCSFNYKEEHAEFLKKHLPNMIAAKIGNKL